MTALPASCSSPAHRKDALFFGVVDRQHAHRHRPGAAGQAQPRPAGGPVRTEGPRGARRPGGRAGHRRHRARRRARPPPRQPGAVPTATSSPRRASRSTSRCSPARPTPSPSNPATSSCRAASSSPAAAGPRSPRSAPTPTPPSWPRRPAGSRWCSSALRNAVDRIIKWVTWLMVPTAIGLVISQHQTQPGWRDALVSAVGGVVAMVPEGLVLLTSVAFAVGVVRLARQRTLVQELPAIEVLARVDVLCLDKTGTHHRGHDGGGRRASRRRRGRHRWRPRRRPGRASPRSDPNPNATQRALAERYHDAPGWTRDRRRAVLVGPQVERGSLRRPRHLGARRAGDGAWPTRYGGALRDEVDREADAGQRVLVLARSDAAARRRAAPRPAWPRRRWCCSWTASGPTRPTRCATSPTRTSP